MCTHKHTLGSNSTLLVATFGQSIAELIAFAALSTGIIFLSFLICCSFLKDEKHGKYVILATFKTHVIRVMHRRKIWFMGQRIVSPDESH